jgi:hypothetical protein
LPSDIAFLKGLQASALSKIAVEENIVPTFQTAHASFRIFEWQLPICQMVPFGVIVIVLAIVVAFRIVDHFFAFLVQLEAFRFIIASISYLLEKAWRYLSSYT